MEGHSLYGARTAAYEIDAERSLNIDGPEDWARAERLLAPVGGSPSVRT